jgi:hypothetical protein
MLASVARDLLANIDVAVGIRLLGIAASQLVEPQPAQGVLAFADDETAAGEPEHGDRRAAVERAVDAVRDRFGDRAVRAATLVRAPEEPR